MPNTTTVTLPIGGMTCAACQSHVESALRKTTGVVAADVHLMSRDATVVFDSAAASPADLVAAVKRSGYEASLPAQGKTWLESQADRDTAHIAEVRALAVRAVIASIAALLAMGAMFFVHPHGVAWQLVVALIAIGVGSPIFVRALRSARHGNTDMNTLISLGCLAALSQNEYAEAALSILAFALVGRTLEARAKRHATAAMLRLQGLTTENVRIEGEDGSTTTMPVRNARVGDVLIVLAGERIALDGVVLDGASDVEESMITGEPLPIAKQPNDAVTGGTINRSNRLKVRVTAIGDETVLSRLVRLLYEAEGKRAKHQQLADRVSAVFVPAVVVLATVTLLGWHAYGATWTESLQTAISVLVIACPCALGLAVPTAVVVATGRAASQGIVIKNGEALERVANVDTVVFDKTGTLTEGTPRVETMDMAENVSELDVLEFARAVGSASTHPLSQAIIRYASERGARERAVSNETTLAGQGVRGTVNARQLALGNALLLSDVGAAIPARPRNPSSASTEVHLAIDGAWAATFTLSDSVRAEAPSVVQALQSDQKTVHLLTGDTEAAAANVGRDVGITEIRSRALPADKVTYVTNLASTGRRVAMIGDGINDAPALRAASVGVAMGTGTDIAAMAADVTLMGSDLRALPALFTLAKKTTRTMRANLFWAFAYNVVMIPAAAGLFSGFGLILTPTLASACMALSSVSVVLSSLRLRTA